MSDNNVFDFDELRKLKSPQPLRAIAVMAILGLVGLSLFSSFYQI